MQHEVVLIHDQDNIHNGDILFILSYWRKVDIKYLSNFRTSVVIHESDLPKGRGWSPMTWQILEGKNTIPIVLFEANSKIDSGKIYLKDEIILEGHELIDEIRLKQAMKTIELCDRFIHLYPDIINEGVLQIGEPSFYPRRTPKDSRLDVSKTIEEQFNLLRVVDNDQYPAFFDYKGHRYIIKICKGVKDKNE